MQEQAGQDETEDGGELVRLVDGYLDDLQQGKTPTEPRSWQPIH